MLPSLDDPTDWLDSRVTLRPPAWEPPASCVGWATEDSGPILVLVGDASRRSASYNAMGCSVPLNSWKDGLLPKWLATSLSQLRSKGSIVPHNWDILWNLITLEEGYLDATLTDFLDQRRLYAKIYRSLTVTRQRLDENIEVGSAVRALGKWLMEGVLDNTYEQELLGMKGPNKITAPYERFDALLFVATLASVNDLLPPSILILDGLEGVLEHYHRKGLAKELADLCLALDRWARLGGPIRVAMGVTSPTAVEGLIRVYPPLESYLRPHLTLV